MSLLLQMSIFIDTEVFQRNLVCFKQNLVKDLSFNDKQTQLWKYTEFCPYISIQIRERTWDGHLTSTYCTSRYDDSVILKIWINTV